ncbi:hypothetical protein D3C86_1665550 [compost metagenome]
MTARHLRAHVGEQHAAPHPRREQPRAQGFVGHHLLLEQVARGAEAPRLLQIDQPVGIANLLQTLGRPLHFRQLVAAVGDQQQRLAAVALRHHDGAVASQLTGLFGVEHAGPLALGHHQTGQPAAALVDLR